MLAPLRHKVKVRTSAIMADNLSRVKRDFDRGLAPADAYATAHRMARRAYGEAEDAFDEWLSAQPDRVWRHRWNVTAGGAA